MTMKDRVEKAVELFKSGYNCSQSVVAAFADMYGFTQEQALRMSASFGGGIGRMRQTCGAACGMFLLAGLEKGAVDGKDREGKAANYALVQQLAEEFRKRNGSMICAELLGLKKPEGSSTPEARTEQYYAKRPCAKMVEEAAAIWGGVSGKNSGNRAKSCRFSGPKWKKMRVNVLYNIKITIFAAEIKSVSSVGGNGFLSMSN